jgi:exodeoxyribonuclease VII large subunit
MEIPAGEPVYTVSQLSREARILLERSFPPLWVTGEISNMARPGSGHLYFSLKDAEAQVRCAMFRSAGRSLRFRPENGQQVMVRGRVSLYEARGEFQLVVEHMEPAGDGLLLRRLEELKKRLAAEGLFDERHKQPLPSLPRCIGLITSPTGAAIRDVLHVLRRRFPAIPVVIYPVQVQGAQAKHDIVAALRTATARHECDVLILARGGGSLEDLWAFNEEMVARAMHACPIPLVSGVGHEIDFTIADLVADLRAPTPSGAAELVVPDSREWIRSCVSLERQVRSCMQRVLQRLRARQAELAARLRRGSPGVVLRQRCQRLDELGQRLRSALLHNLQLRRLRIRHAGSGLRRSAPVAALRRCSEQVIWYRLRLAGAVRVRIASTGQRLAVSAAALQAVSPLRTLERGYAIVRDPQTGHIIRRARDLIPGQDITGTLSEGAFDAVVSRVRRDS